MAFLKNCWYVFGYGEEVTLDKFCHRTIADEPILIYRTEGGDVAALHDRCPHRFLPLHMGRQKDDLIECAYHGLRFDTQGECRGVEESGVNPKGACVRTYPVVERDTLLWVWIGEPAKADESIIPNFSFLSDPNRKVVGGYIYTKANYQLSIDNLMDLTHVQFVHETQQASEAFERATYEVEVDEDSVTAHLTFPNGKPSPVMSAAAPEPDRPIDTHFFSKWTAPAQIILTVTGNNVGEIAPLYESISVHIPTPETKDTCHYFFLNSRDYALDDEAVDEHIRTWQRRGFDEEDKPVLEQQQLALQGQDIEELDLVGLRSDGGVLRVRRIIRQMLESQD